MARWILRMRPLEWWRWTTGIHEFRSHHFISHHECYILAWRHLSSRGCHCTPGEELPLVQKLCQSWAILRLALVQWTANGSAVTCPSMHLVTVAANWMTSALSKFIMLKGGVLYKLFYTRDFGIMSEIRFEVVMSTWWHHNSLSLWLSRIYF